MKSTSGNKIQIIISYAVFILSGFLIFSPLHKSENLPLSLLCSIGVSAAALTIILLIVSSNKKKQKKHIILNATIAVTACISCLFASLMLLTEIIKDVAYIANRGVSLFYYTFIALVILFVSFYLCTSSVKGVYRFTILSAIAFIFLFIIIYFSLFTTKHIIVNFTFNESSLLSPVLTGIRAGLFFTIDSSVYLICFSRQIKDDKVNIPKKTIFLGFITAYIFIILYNLFTVMIFGQLTTKISDPDYALIKLLYGIDLTEIISAIRIISFLIKSSLYIFLSAEYLKSAFPKLTLSKNSLLFVLYLLIPITFLILALFDKTLEYGAFQHMIYPITAIMSVCFIILHKTFQKKNY